VKLERPDLAAYALAALGLVCLTVLIAIGRVVPDYLPLIVMTVVGAGGGIALNTRQGSETITTRGTGPAASPGPAPAGLRSQVPAQRPAPQAPALGVQAG
jgi:hypothetical protein